jgi:hypothetical protein
MRERTGVRRDQQRALHQPQHHRGCLLARDRLGRLQGERRREHRQQAVTGMLAAVDWSWRRFGQVSLSPFRGGACGPAQCLTGGLSVACAGQLDFHVPGEELAGGVVAADEVVAQGGVVRWRAV